MSSESTEAVHAPRIIPLRDYIIVKKDPPKEKTKGGIIVPEAARAEKSQAQSNSGIVMAVGKGKRENGVVTPPEVSVGQRVYWGVYFGSDIEFCGVNCILMRESDITAVEG